MPSLEGIGAEGAAVAAPQPIELALAAEKPTVEAEDSKRRRLFRFRPRYDLALLSEVITHFPWAAGYGNTRDAWDAVALSVQKRLSESGVEVKAEAPLDYTIVKRRVDVLLDAFRRGETASLRGPGTPKEFETRNKLLGILLALVDQHYTHKGKVERAGSGVSKEDRMKEALREAQQQLRSIDLTAQGELEEGQSSPPAEAKAMTLRGSPYSGLKRKPEIDLTGETVAPVKRGRGRPPRSAYAGRGRPPNKPAAAVGRPASAPVATVEAEGARELALRERELQIRERRLEIEEQRLAWQMKEAEQQSQERLALLDVLRAQSALNQELLAQLRAKPAIA